MTYRLTFVLSSVLAATCLGAGGQAIDPLKPTTKPVKMTGCVAHALDVEDAYAFSNDKMCVELKGTVKPDSLVDHMATLEGMYAPASDGKAASFTAGKMLATGDACSKSCMLKPPPGRGIHKKEPGLPGATDGEQAPPAAPHP